MVPTRSLLFQSVRWFIVSVSIAMIVWMLYSGVHMIWNMPMSWITPLLGILFLAFVAPLGLIAYFGLKGEYRRFFTTIIFIFSLSILLFSSSQLSQIRFTDLIRAMDQPIIVEGFAGILLSVLQVAAPFIPAIFFYRIFMDLLSKSGFTEAKHES